MTDIVGALAAVRTRLTALGSGITCSLRFQGDEQAPLPDTPTAFAYVILNNEGSGRGPAAFGGGRGQNLYRNGCLLEAWVFSPANEGAAIVLAHAETVAARLRSFRDSTVSCFSADVLPAGPGASIAPPGLNSEVSNYQCAMVEVFLTFDQIG